MLHNFALFGAPHAAFLFMPADGGLREAADCSKFAQTFMLALAAAGLGSCPQASLSGYPSIIRSALRLEGEPGKLLLGMSFGYPDDDDPTALARPPRCPTHDVVRSEEHTSELQSLMRISYAVFCLKKKKTLKLTHDERCTTI